MARLSASLFAVLALWLLVGFAAKAASPVPLTIEVKGVKPDGSPSATQPTVYRWTVEQDATKASIPGKPADTSNYSFSFHTSYMPVVAAGRRCGAGLCAVPSAQAGDPDVARLYGQAFPSIDPDKRYFVSIAAEGFQMGGAPVVFSGGSAKATVYLNEYPVPTAQVSVFVFNDNSPINGAPDLPQETGLQGFHVRLIEAGGTYGASGGEVTQDAFGNPLGTTYDTDGNVIEVGSGIIVSDANGVALIKNLYPAKYTIYVDPPVGTDWHQTSTIEGTRGIDAWVKNNEPPFFQEFGPPGHHVFIGFTRSGRLAGTNANGDCQVGVDTPCAPLLNGGNTVTGRIINTHHSRPPVYTFFHGAPVTECWVGLNEANGGRALYATACNKDGTFTIPNVPAGTWEIAIWDDPLDMIIGATTVTITGSQNLGDLPVSSWFGRYQGRVFQDIDGTGLPYFAADFDRPFIYVDPVTNLEYESTQKFKAGDLKPPFGEGIANNIRFRDGSIYQSVTTKKDGTFAFTEVFPFFNFMVAEIDYARFKATSASVVVDDGGEINPAANQTKLWKADKGQFGSNDPDLAYDPWTRLNPQRQADTECPPGVTPPCYFRLESVDGGPGAILLEAMQLFLGSTNHVEWGKTPYTINENGGIAGIVYYAITRAEDDPRYAAAENWEPGIPRVQVNVFLDCDHDGKPDKPKNDGSGLCEAGGLSGADHYVYDQPDVDNYPFCWRDEASIADPSICPNGKQMGPEDRQRVAPARRAAAAARQAAALGVPVAVDDYLYGDAFRWGGIDANGQPLGPQAQIQWGVGKTDSWDDSIPTGCPDPTPYKVPSTGEKLDCFDGLRNFNQMRPAVFDGGFAFGRVAGQPELPMIIGAEGKGTYILEAVAPPGYLHQGNGDKNVVFGDTLKPASAALPFECVGQSLPVPEYLTLFPGERNPNFDAGQTSWNKCDMKAVPLLPGQNAAPNFFMFTEAPVAGHGVGFILDDTASEFNTFAPNFGEKYSPPHLPISVRDWTDREIARVYSDQFGSFNFVVPSSFTINPPYPSGVMPSMMVACMNHPGPIPDPNDPTKQILDPFFNRSYTTFCYTLQYLPGKTTYLDTPVLPSAAFAAVDKNPLDCECADGTPGIYSVNNGTDNGPWVPATGNRDLVIVSQGLKDVINPAYDPNLFYRGGTCSAGDATCTTDANDVRLKKTVKRNFGFGQTPGTVMLGTTALTVAAGNWSDGLITVSVPGSVGAGQYQLAITRGDNGKESVVGITVHVAGSAPIRVNPNGRDVAGCGSGAATPCKTIQFAMDKPQTGNGSLITVAPGVYNEYVIMDKRVRLQGWGAGSAYINAAKSGTTALAAWRQSINARAGVKFDLLPGQTLGIDPANNEPLLFGADEGPGVLVVGRAGNNPNNPNCNTSGGNPLIDGLTVTGSDSGGGILASGYACNLTVSNNRITGNYGTYGGGVRIGHVDLLAGDGTYTDAVNRSVSIHHNWIAQNGATEAGGGGGITLGTGSDGYSVDRNYICGNFSMADGGGLSHLGRPQGNQVSFITRNKFIFNQTFNQLADPMGGGASIAGQIPVGGGASEGTGRVTVEANLFQGNQAGSGAGGGLSIARTNASVNPRDIVLLTNNIIVNNVAAYTGGGVALTDITVGNNQNQTTVSLVNNTIASNVATSTNRQAADPRGWGFPSLPKVAGIAVVSGSSPTLVNNIVWANRSYIYVVSGTNSGLCNPGATSLSVVNGVVTCAPAGNASYRDLGRINGSGNLAPTYSVLTTGGANDHVTASGTNVFEAASSTTLFVKKNDFASIIDPTQPVVLPETTVNLRSALTFDETGNFINVIFSPLTLWEISGANIGELRADYHLASPSSAAVNRGTTGGQVPATDYDGDARVAPIDVGADEFLAPPPPKPTLSVLDNFNRANANTLGANWQQLVSLGNAGLRVNGNQAFCVNSGLAAILCALDANGYWNGGSPVFGAKQAAQFTFVNTTLNNAGVYLKASGAFNTTLGYYPSAVRVRYNGGQVTVETTTNGVTFTSAAVLTGSFASGDTMTAQIDAAGLVTVWKTSGATVTFIGSAQTTYTGTGRIGMFLPSGGRVDDFAGGTVP